MLFLLHARNGHICLSRSGSCKVTNWFSRHWIHVQKCTSSHSVTCYILQSRLSLGHRWNEKRNLVRTITMCKRRGKCLFHQIVVNKRKNLLFPNVSVLWLLGCTLGKFTQLKWNKRFDNFMMLGSKDHYFILLSGHLYRKPGGHKIVCTGVKFKSCFNVVKNHANRFLWL